MGVVQLRRLIQLEIKKYNLLNYWKAVVICNISIIAVLIAIFILEKYEGELLFQDFEMAMDISNALIRVTFLIFSTVIMIKIIIDEYKNNMIGVMFTYPISRKKIMTAKLMIISGFSFFTILISSLLVEGFIYIMDRAFDIVPGTINLEQLQKALTTSVLGALASAGISLIPLHFGLLKKTATATLVSSLLIFSVTNTTNNMLSLFSYIGIPLVLGLFGVLIGYINVRKLERIDL